MPSLVSVPALVLDPSENPEHYELLNGQWEKKECVGRKDHSAMGQTLYNLLRPTVKELGCEIYQEWTVVQGGKRVVPDVTVSYPAPFCQVEDGYLAAPAFLAIESRSPGQRLQKLVDKCIQDHHAMGTRYCWIIDIDGGDGYECHLGQKNAKPVSVLTAGPDISLSVEQLFAEFRAEL